MLKDKSLELKSEVEIGRSSRL